MYLHCFARGFATSLLRTVVALLAFSALSSPCRASNPGDAIVVLAVKFSDGSTDWGTGAFVDHDGLILTADHVVHRAIANPLSTMTDGSVPASSAPIGITVYSTHLVTPLTVNVAAAGNVLGGAYSANQWMDAAFVRATLTDVQRAMIEPLDISLSPPNQTELLTAWGPHCTDVTSPNCGTVNAVDSVTVTLSSNPSVNRDYQVRANLNLGFSGGPLINSAGMIVGIASWGLRPDGAPTTGTQIVTATYVPGHLIVRNLSGNISSSSWLLTPSGCSHTTDFRPLTAVDTGEMFPSDPKAADCPCCCSTLSRSPNSINTRVGNSSCAKQCPQNAALALANFVQLAANTGTVDAQTVNDYAKLRALIASSDVDQLPPDQRAKLYDSFGATGLAIALSHSAQQFPSLSVATQDALVAYKMRLTIGDSPAVYENVSQLFIQEGNSVKAADARVMSDVAGESPDTKNAIDLNVNKLKKKMFVDVPSSMSREVAVHPTLPDGASD
jgi:Trypsin-like peptidase domain